MTRQLAAWPFIPVVALAFVSAGCTSSPSGSSSSAGSGRSGSGDAPLWRVDAGPRTEPVPLEVYQHVHYVSQATGSDDRGDGSRTRPWQTLAHALAQTRAAGPSERHAVLVAAGTYRGATFVMRPHVDLFGGFDAGRWRRDIAAHPTILDGGEARRVLVGADRATLDGFVVQNGAVRGHGGALLLERVATTVTNNVFTRNRTLKPEPWAPALMHETAHDGGAIGCRGCSARIEHNLFVDNRTEIGRGGALACDNETAPRASAAPRVRRNVFLRNVASAGADPMRSGDGGALAFNGYCQGTIADNIVIENEAASVNDGGGLFLSLWSAPIVADNVIAGNTSGDDAGGIFVGGQKHHYGTPLDPVPPAGAFFVRVERNVIVGNRNGSPTSGALRATMMTRGVFQENVTAENPGGVYAQRSELLFLRNIFVGDARYEDKRREAPGPTVFRDNIITGTRLWEAPVTEAGTCGTPSFVDDGFGIAAAAAEDIAFEPDRQLTRVRTPGARYAPNALLRRVVQAGDRWSVVYAHDADTLWLWGDLRTARTFVVKPSYRVDAGSPCVDRQAADPAARGTRGAS